MGSIAYSNTEQEEDFSQQYGFLSSPNHFASLVDEFNLLRDNGVARTAGSVSSEKADQSLLGVGSERPVVRVRRIEILKYLINSLSGKDKLAKIVKSLLELLRLVISKSSISITRWDPTVLRYYNKILSSDWNTRLRTFASHPLTFSKIFLLSLLRQFGIKADFVAQQLGIYRYILRFGSAPFSFIRVIQVLRECQRDLTHSEKITWLLLNKKLINEANLRLLLDSYYSVLDELELLYKLKLWNHKPLYDVITKQDSFAWQVDICLNLKDTWYALRNIESKQLELHIQQQVRSKALEISKSLQISNRSPVRKHLLRDLSNDNGTLVNDLAKQLQVLQKDKTLAYLDLCRLITDFVSNTTELLQIKTPAGTSNVLSLTSGVLGFAKLWIKAIDELSK